MYPIVIGAPGRHPLESDQWHIYIRVLSTQTEHEGGGEGLIPFLPSTNWRLNWGPSAGHAGALPLCYDPGGITGWTGPERLHSTE